MIYPLLISYSEWVHYLFIRGCEIKDPDGHCTHSLQVDIQIFWSMGYFIVMHISVFILIIHSKNLQLAKGHSHQHFFEGKFLYCGDKFLGNFWEFLKKSVIAKIWENLSNFQNPKIGEKKNHHQHQGKKALCN